MLWNICSDFQCCKFKNAIFYSIQVTCTETNILYGHCISRWRCCQSVFTIPICTFHSTKDALVGFDNPIHYLIVAPSHRSSSSSQSLSVFPYPHHKTEHKEARSCGSSFSLMLMHILSLLHTNVSWPRPAVCLLLDLHLLSEYRLQFNLTLEEQLL